MISKCDSPAQHVYACSRGETRALLRRPFVAMLVRWPRPPGCSSRAPLRALRASGSCPLRRPRGVSLNLATPDACRVLTAMAPISDADERDILPSRLLNALAQALRVIVQRVERATDAQHRLREALWRRKEDAQARVMSPRSLRQICDRELAEDPHEGPEGLSVGRLLDSVAEREVGRRVEGGHRRDVLPADGVGR